MKEVTEEFRPVPDFPGYEVSNLGRIRSHRGKSRGAVLRPAVGKNGYITVRLRRDGRYHSWYLHRLVAFVFYGPPPEGMETCHNNGIRTDCRASNLRWGTRRENARDRMTHGTQYIPDYPGEKHPMCKLTEADVRTIRARRAEGVQYPALAKEFGITQTHVCRIVLRQSWKHIT